jgi:hypothetical protein
VCAFARHCQMYANKGGYRIANSQCLLVGPLLYTTCAWLFLIVFTQFQFTIYPERHLVSRTRDVYYYLLGCFEIKLM